MKLPWHKKITGIYLYFVTLSHCNSYTINCHDWINDPQGLNYKGGQSSGIERSIDDPTITTEVACQYWNSDWPNHNEMADAWDFSPTHNYCRNPDRDSKGPWCYKSVEVVRENDEPDYVFCKDLISQCLTGDEPEVFNDDNSSRETIKNQQQTHSAPSSDTQPQPFEITKSDKVDSHESTENNTEGEQECYDWTNDQTGINYQGTQEIGISNDGYEYYCQEWSSDYPQFNKMRAKYNFAPDHNYCRNPDEDKNGPWCYLNGEIGKGERDFIYCKDLIPQCDDLQKVESVTIVNAPSHDAIPTNFQAPSHDTRSNYGATCSKSNPSGRCFSSKGTTGQEYAMPHFKNNDNRKWCQDKCKDSGYMFAGLLERSKCMCMNCYNDEDSNQCNRQCQDFPQNKFCGGEKSMNVYQVSASSSRATTSTNNQQRAATSTKSSSHSSASTSSYNNCYDWQSDPTGRNYRGTQSKSAEFTCQPWNVNYPHKNRYASYGFKPDHNYCRNPNRDSKGPWCYKYARIGNRESPITYCKDLIPQCSKNTNTSINEIVKSSNSRAVSTQSKTSSSTRPTNDGNNSDNSKCYDWTNDPTGRNYRGTQSKSDGFTCQPWNVNYPHKNKYASYGFKPEHNYCRNPNRDPNGPWCYKYANVRQGEALYTYCKDSIPQCQKSTSNSASSHNNQSNHRRLKGSLGSPGSLAFWALERKNKGSSLWNKK